MNLGPMSGQDKGQRAPAIHTVKEDPNMPDSDVIVSCHMLPLSSDYYNKSLKETKSATMSILRKFLFSF